MRQQLLVDHNRRRPDRADRQTPLEDEASRFFVSLRQSHSAPLTHPDLVRMAKLEARLGCQFVKLAREFFRQPFVVRIEKCNPCTRSVTDPGIARSTDAQIRLAQTGDIRKAARQFVRGGIGRTVVHDDDFIRQPGL